MLIIPVLPRSRTLLHKSQLMKTEHPEGVRPWQWPSQLPPCASHVDAYKPHHRVAGKKFHRAGTWGFGRPEQIIIMEICLKFCIQHDLKDNSGNANEKATIGH